MTSPSPYIDASLQSSVSTKVLLIDPKLYVLDTLQWQLNFADVEWYVNGALEWSKGSATQLLMDGSGFTPLVPSSIPLIGCPAVLEAGYHIGAQLAENAQT